MTGMASKAQSARPLWMGVALIVPALVSPGLALPASDAKAVIEQALDATGGGSMLQGLHFLRLRTYTTTYRLDDSERADGPFWADFCRGGRGPR